MTQLSPELNDIDIKPVFDWFGKQEIYDTTGTKFEVWIRLVGDSEVNQARVFALRKVYDLKLKLRDETSDEYMALMAGIVDLENEQLLQSLLYFKFQELVREASKTVKIKYPKEPSSDSEIDKQAEYQHELDTWNSKLEKAIQDYVEPRISKLKYDYSNKDYDFIISEYKKFLTTQMCEMEFQNAFRSKCVYFGTFKDEELKHKFFDTFEDFDNLRTDVKKQFIEFYTDLEVSTEELKK